MPVSREKPTGRYAPDWKTLCECGHSLGDHTAEGKLSEKDCTICPQCSGFRKMKTRKNPRRRTAAQKAATARLVAFNKNRKQNHSIRRRNPGHTATSRFQITKFSDDHPWFWNGARWTANRSDAALYRTVKLAKSIARLSTCRCAVVSQHEHVSEIVRFLTGKR